MVEDKKKKGDGGNGDGDKDESGITALQDQLKTLTESLEGQKKANAELLEQVKKGSDLTDPSYMTYLEELEKKISAQGTTSDKVEDEEDLNRMSGEKLVEHLQGSFTKSLEDVTKKMQDSLDTLSTEVNKVSVGTSVELARLRHEGLDTLLSTDEGKEKFYEVAGKNKNWTATEIWEDLEKSSKIEAYDKREQEAKEEEEASKVDTEHGGSLPKSIAEKDPLEVTDEEAARAGLKVAFGNKRPEDLLEEQIT